MTRERALEIIAAYGGDSRRWPDGERAAVLAMAADDDVAAAIAGARRLDAALDDWARADMAAGLDFAAMTAEAQEGRAAARMTPRKRQWPGRWLAGGALAASVAVAVVLLGPVRTGAPVVETVSTISPVPSATAKGGAAVSDAEAFASVFTPTVDEEEVI